MSDLAYSGLLAAAMVTAAVALGLALLPRLGVELPTRSGRWTGVAALGALVLVLLATAIHLVWGHPPGSARALALPAFIAEHPALVAVSALAAAGLVIRRRTS